MLLTPQLIVFTGLLVAIIGCCLDINLVRYGFLGIVGGTIISVLGAIFWLRVPVNRFRLQHTFKIAKNFDEMSRQAFDFRWSRVSIMWTICAFIGITAIHLQSLTMKSYGAYGAAVISVRQNENIRDLIGEIVGFSYIVTGYRTTDGISEIRFGVIGSKDKIKITAIVNGRDGVFVTDKILINE